MSTTTLRVNNPKQFEEPSETFMRELWDHLEALYCDWGYGKNTYPIDYDSVSGLAKANEFCNLWNKEAGHLLYVDSVTYVPDKNSPDLGDIIVTYREL